MEERVHPVGIQYQAAITTRSNNYHQMGLKIEPEKITVIISQ